MKSPYLAVRKLEFVLTNACNGRCRHCSEGSHKDQGTVLDGALGAETVRLSAELFRLETVLVFGGEPLLFPEAAAEILSAARDVGVPRRQIITNGAFSGESARIREVARLLGEAGTSDLLLSVDAFHAEHLPQDRVLEFARAVLDAKIPMRLSPAWLVSREDDNSYNRETRRLLAPFLALGIPEGEGNVIFPEGNAKRYLAEYFRGQAPQNPYVEDPYCVTCLSVSPNGDLLGGNLYRQDVREIVRRYTPL